MSADGSISHTLVGTAVKRAAVYLDRDGVLNRPVVKNGLPYPPLSLAEFELYPEVYSVCERLKAAGYLLIVATNQPDVGRGTLAKERVDEIHEFLREQLPLDEVVVCLHGGERYGQSCSCRKPLPGMLTESAERFRLDLNRSWMIGDRWRDIDCGAAAGCRTILIQRGYDETLRMKPDFVADSLEAAAEIILSVSY
ncbi:MAG: HAD-IIIA family hydrolase [Verrucomicrobiota bacterium]